MYYFVENFLWYRHETKTKFYDENHEVLVTGELKPASAVDSTTIDFGRILSVTDQLLDLLQSLVANLLKSTLVISNSKGPSEILRDIRTSTYQIYRIEEKIIRTTTFNIYIYIYM